MEGPTTGARTKEASSTEEAEATTSNGDASEVQFRQYLGEEDLPTVMGLVDTELSEPYSIFTYRYFLNQWPQLCFLAYCGGQCVATIVCKMEDHPKSRMFRGYIAMLVVIKPFRGMGIGSTLVRKSLEVMRDSGCQEVILEAEVTNSGALALYGNLGFIRAKRLHSYYLNGVDAFRLKLLFPQAYMEDPSLAASNDDEDEEISLDLDQTKESQKWPSSQRQADQRHHERTWTRIPDQIL
ncbi:peptide alpha-N-acetyltransferase [Klebsormidium nitens]|uniref:Peptide alpha-N-acetyltransferase n=1 Tax=Klebsormidium nitens TaxID=105231 RepID=A0A1Y1IKU3_KLENI|nr:peptide alpha-N-acetyltransferase [Klebsormidium nitens]|eukprot:GAQ89761.1 peptide alpha-N-acetyltransferase [Klebsormidium nitens]